MGLIRCSAPPAMMWISVGDCKTRAVRSVSVVAAVVWHFRRNTVRDYITTAGVIKAEALLFFKHPSRFNVLGQSRWFGRIYGDLSSFLASRQPRIYTVFCRGPFQTLYQPRPSIISCLPLTLEWNSVSMLLLCALVFGGVFWVGVAPLFLT